MTRLFKDNYTTTLTSSISDSTTTIPVASVTNLPTIGAGDTCVLTIQFGSTIERVNATAVSTLDLTVTRAVEGSSASAFPSGSLVSLRATAKVYEERVIGASSSVDNAIPRFDGTTGKLIQASNVRVSDENELLGAGVSLSTKTSDYSIVAGDAGKLFLMDKVTAIEAELPDPSTVDDGFQVGISQHNTGTCTVATAAGSIVSKGGLTDLNGQYAMAVAVRLSSSVWGLYGDLA